MCDPPPLDSTDFYLITGAVSNVSSWMSRRRRKRSESRGRKTRQRRKRPADHRALSLWTQALSIHVGVHLQAFMLEGESR